MLILNRLVSAPAMIVYRVSKGVGLQHTTFTKLASTQLFREAEAKSATVCNSEHPEMSASGLKTGSADPSRVAGN